MKKKLLKVSMLSIISITGMLSFAPCVDAKNTNTKDIYLSSTNMPNHQNPQDIQQQDMPSNDNMNEMQKNGTTTSNNNQDPKTKSSTDKKTTNSQYPSTMPQDKLEETM